MLRRFGVVVTFSQDQKPSIGMLLFLEKNKLWIIDLFFFYAVELPALQFSHHTPLTNFEIPVCHFSKTPSLPELTTSYPQVL